MISLGMALMTVGILQFTVIPLIADINRSHVANPDWPGHARFHVLTQVLTTSALGLVALFSLWSGRLTPELGVCVAMLCSVAALAPFFISVATRRLYGGELMPVRFGIARLHLGMVEGNVLNFGSAAALILIGRLLLQP